MDKRTINIQATIPERWLPDFVAMLKAMEYCGSVGASRWVCLYSDGDGDFRPKFNISGLPNDFEPTKGYDNTDQSRIEFDAG